MRAKLETVPAPRVPNLVFRDDLPYVAGQCFSCGDPLGEFVFGRCWRCRLAWRLAAEVWPHAEMGRAIDDARVA
jgi:hypothetical protein